MREAIKGYTEAVIEEAAGATPVPGVVATRRDGEPGDLNRLAGDLEGVRDVVAGSGDLRLVLGDTGVPSHARRGLMSDLFGAQVSPEALRLLLYTVDTDRATATVADINWLATRVRAAVDGRHPVGAAVLGHHAALERVDGYATEVLQPLDADRDLVNVEDELFRFERIVIGSAELSEALCGRDLEAQQRSALVADLLSGRASDVTIRLATYATKVGRPRDYQDLLGALVARVAAEGQRRVAEVRAVVELTEAQRARLAAVLSRLIGQRVDVRTVVDPSVLGGFVATVGDTVIDGSTRHRVDLLKERLATGEAASAS